MGVVGEERQLIADTVILSGLITFQSKSRMEGGGGGSWGRETVDS